MGYRVPALKEKRATIVLGMIPMSKLISEVANMDAAKGILHNPHHPYWDEAPTRREVMGLINALVNSQKELAQRSDTAYLVLNLLCEKGSITPGEIEAYVAKKSAEVKAWKEKLADNIEAEQKA